MKSNKVYIILETLCILTIVLGICTVIFYARTLGEVLTSVIGTVMAILMLIILLKGTFISNGK